MVTVTIPPRVMSSEGMKTDQEHADAIRQATSRFNNALKNAHDAGLTVALKISNAGSNPWYPLTCYDSVEIIEIAKKLS